MYQKTCMLILSAFVLIGADNVLAQHGEVTLLMPSRSGLKLPSMRVINPVPSNREQTQAVAGLVSALKKAGLEAVTTRDLMVYDCTALVTGNASRLSCYLAGKEGGKCALEPSMVPNDQAVRFLKTYYESCESKDIVPAEHGRNLKR